VRWANFPVPRLWRAYWGRMPRGAWGQCYDSLLQIKISHPIAGSQVSNGCGHRPPFHSEQSQGCAVCPCCSQAASISLQTSFFLALFRKSKWVPHGQLVLGSGVHDDDTRVWSKCD